MAKGGKRAGAGRKPGPKKVQFTAHVLPVTKQEMYRRAMHHSSVGQLLDTTFKPRTKI
jgi:hypothetical protein